MRYQTCSGLGVALFLTIVTPIPAQNRALEAVSQDKAVIFVTNAPLRFQLLSVDVAAQTIQVAPTNIPAFRTSPYPETVQLGETITLAVSPVASLLRVEASVSPQALKVGDMVIPQITRAFPQPQLSVAQSGEMRTASGRPVEIRYNTKFSSYIHRGLRVTSLNPVKVSAYDDKPVTLPSLLSHEFMRLSSITLSDIAAAFVAGQRVEVGILQDAHGNLELNNIKVYQAQRSTIP